MLFSLRKHSAKAVSSGFHIQLVEKNIKIPNEQINNK